MIIWVYEYFFTHGFGRQTTPDGVAVYSLYGALFFAAVGRLEAVPDELPAGTRTLVLDAHQLVSTDASGLNAIENVHRTLARMGVRLVVAGLNPQPLEALHRAGLDATLGAGNLFADRAAALRSIASAAGRVPPQPAEPSAA